MKKYITIIHYITTFQTVYTKAALNNDFGDCKLFLVNAILFTIVFDWEKPKTIIVWIYQFSTVDNHRE